MNPSHGWSGAAQTTLVRFRASPVNAGTDSPGKVAKQNGTIEATLRPIVLGPPFP